ncbi:hypothetical protein J4456_00475 [Candidatus Pacearchaeota archaeon]|nr:hypothetical protein [Candidatus Pacearchaeota archaeon]
MKNEKRNELFKRTEIEFVIESEINPTYEEVRNMVAEKYSKPAENVDVLTVKGNFGKQSFNSIVYVYDTTEKLAEIKSLEKTRKKRKEEDKAKKEAEKAKADADKAKVEAEKAAAESPSAE